MVADTRSTRKMKNEADGDSSTSMRQEGLRRSTRGSPLTQVPLPATRSKSKSQSVEKLATPSPRRRSEMGDNATNNDPRPPVKEPSPLNSKRRKEKTVMESKNAVTESEEGSLKRKRMTARAYGAIFRMQRLPRPDAVVELEQSDQSLHVSSHNDHGTDLISASEDVNDKSGEINLCRGREECTDKDLSGAHTELISDSNDGSPNISGQKFHEEGGTSDGNGLDISYGPSTPGEKRGDSNNCGEKILGYSKEEECVNKATNRVIPELISGPKHRFPEKPNDCINSDPNLLDTGFGGILDGSGNSSAKKENGTDNSNCGEMISGSAREEHTDKASSATVTELHSGPKDNSPAIPIADVNLDNDQLDTAVNEALDVDGVDQEHCISGQVRKDDVGSIRTIKDACDTSAACTIDGEDNQRNVPASCNRDGELHYCDGKWQCTVCVKKKPLHEQQSRFIEYWVPAELSNYQLELYCSSFLSNSLFLCSSSKSEPFGMLREILFTLRKTCDHPYLLHSSIQAQLFAELRSAGEILDAGIKASGKLLLLDMMLSKIQTQGLKVLVLYQLTVGLTSLGFILEDFLRQKFGQNAYEHVEYGVALSKKQAAVSRFNKKGDGPFVFLLETRACSSSVKPLELDIIITYNSDWNPANDLRTLQKIRIDSTAEQIKVFRLYSACTVEEQALLLSRKNLNIDGSFQTKNRAPLDSLLGWGAFYLFSKLDEHLSNEGSCKSDFSFGARLPNNVIEEFRAIISEDKDTCSYSCISKAQMGVGRYITSIPLHGETKCHLNDGKEPHVFWTNVLKRETPTWKYMTGPSPRTRKRVRYFDTSTDDPGREDSAPKQRKRVVDEVTQNDVSDGGSSSSQRHGDRGRNNQHNISDGNSFRTEALAEERVVSSEEQKSLQLLQLETNKLCRILNLSEETALATRRFLEYVSKNHRTHSDLAPIMHALQISLCWVGASLSGQRIGKRESLVLAKQLLNYQCTEEQLSSVYLKMRSLKRDYIQCSKNDENANRQILSHPGQTQNVKAGGREVNEKLLETRQKCLKTMEKLVQKQQKDIEEFSRTWEEKKRNLESDYKLESVFIRSIYGQGSMRAEQLKILDDNFAKKIEEHNLLKNSNLKNLEAQQLAARNEEKNKTDNLLAELESGLNELKSVSGPQVGSESEDDAGVSQSLRPTIVPEISGHSVSHNESRSSPRDNTNASIEANSNVSPTKTSSSFPPEQLCTGNSNESMVEIPVTGPVEAVAPVQPIESVQAAVLPDCTDLPPQQVLQDEVRQDSVPEVQNQDASTLEANNASPAPCSTSLMVESMTPLPPNFPLTTNDAQMVESSEQMHAVPVDVTSHRSPIAEDEQQSFGEHQNLDDQCRTSGQMTNAESSEQMHAVPVDVTSHRSPVAEDEQQTFGEHQNLDDQCRTSGQMHGITADVTSHRSPIAEAEQQNFDQSEQQNRDNQGRTSEPINDAFFDVSTLLSPVAEVEQQNFNQDEPQNHDDLGTSLPIMEPDLTEIVQDATCRVESLGLHASDYTVVESERRGRLAQDIQPSSSSPLISAAAPQIVGNTCGFQNQNIHPSGITAGYLQGQNSSLLAPPPPSQFNYRHLGRPNEPDPLQHALEQKQKEAELMKKRQEDKMAQLMSDRDKLIQEIVREYDQKRREVEVESNQKKNEHNASMERFRLNKTLAEAFRFKCLDPPRPGPGPGIPRLPQRGTQGLPQLHQPTIQHSTRLHPRAPPQQQQTHQYMVRPSPPILYHNFEPTPPQRLQPPPPPPHPPLVRPHLPSPPSRPPLIGSFSRPNNVPRVGGGEVRSRAPHLQSSDRSNVLQSSAAITPMVIASQASQIRFPPPPMSTTVPSIPSVTTAQASQVRLTPQPSTTVPSILEQRVNLGNGFSTLQSFGPSSSSPRSNQTPNENGVVCLSDDE